MAEGLTLAQQRRERLAAIRDRLQVEIEAHDTAERTHRVLSTQARPPDPGVDQIAAPERCTGDALRQRLTRSTHTAMVPRARSGRRIPSTPADESCLRVEKRMRFRPEGTILSG